MPLRHCDGTYGAKPYSPGTYPQVFHSIFPQGRGAQTLSRARQEAARSGAPACQVPPARSAAPGEQAKGQARTRAGSLREVWFASKEMGLERRSPGVVLAFTQTADLER